MQNTFVNERRRAVNSLFSANNAQYIPVEISKEHMKRCIQLTTIKRDQSLCAMAVSELRALTVTLPGAAVQ